MPKKIVGPIKMQKGRALGKMPPTTIASGGAVPLKKGGAVKKKKGKK